MSMMDFEETAAQAAAIFDANLHALAEQYLADFDYPNDEAKAAALKALSEAIDATANKWIEANCAF